MRTTYQDGTFEDADLPTLGEVFSQYKDGLITLNHLHILLLELFSVENVQNIHTELLWAGYQALPKFQELLDSCGQENEVQIILFEMRDRNARPVKMRTARLPADFAEALVIWDKLKSWGKDNAN